MIWVNSFCVSLVGSYTKDSTDDVIAESETWTVPAKILPSNLTTSIGALRQYLLDPPSLAADPKTLIQKKRKRKPRLDRPRTASDDEDNDGDAELAPGRQRKKKVVEVQNYKSAAFIDDSDDEDEEADKAFFEKEKQLRERMMRMAEQQAGQVMERLKSRKGGKGGKGKGRGKGKEKEKEGSRVVLDEDGGLALVTPDSSDVEVGSDEDGESEEDSDSDDESEGGDDRRRKRRRSSQIIQSDDAVEDEPIMTRGPISKETIDSDSD